MIQYDQFNTLFNKLLAPVDEYNDTNKSISELFKKRLEKYNIARSQAELAMDMQSRSLDAILDNSAQRVDIINILKLSQFLGLKEMDFIRSYIHEADSSTIRELEITRKRVFILSHFDLKTLKKANFFDKLDFDEIELRINKFFGIDNIYDYVKKTNYIPAFSKPKRNPRQLMREFWVASALAQFESLNNPNIYNRDELTDLIPKIRPYTMNVENGLKTVIQALYNVGVTVIYQPHLPTTQVRGATFILKEKKQPCIAITDLNKNYASIWFALIHELCHVLYDFDDIEKQVFHMTGEVDLLLNQEEGANKFSRDYLFSEERSKYIYPNIDNHYVVSSYAKQSQVHPCIVYDFYKFDMEKEGKNYWGYFKEHYPDVSIALKELRDGSPYEYATIEESVKFLKENVYNL